MNMLQLQARLRASGRYTGALDGQCGPQTREAVLTALTDGPDTRLSEADFTASAARLGCEVAAIKAVSSVEASGAAFIDGRPTILFEPHRFSRATGHRFDAAHPGVSYRVWDRSRYPRTQADRYAQLLEAVGLDVDAGFASASYGRFQILGENFAACGFTCSFDFAEAEARDEAAQLRAFEGFVTANGLVSALRRRDWAAFAAGYNGSGYLANHYDTRLAQAYAAAG